MGESHNPSMHAYNASSKSSADVLLSKASSSPTVKSAYGIGSEEANHSHRPTWNLDRGKQAVEVPGR